MTHDPVDETGSARWHLICSALVIPLGAIFHHAVFYRPTCMLNPIRGQDYTLTVVIQWLSRDPSVYLAIIVAFITFKLGKRVSLIRLIAPFFLIAFLPLSLWIWDIPFTGRTICKHFHDERVLLADGVPLQSRHLYALGLLLFSGMLVMRSRQIATAVRQLPFRRPWQ